MPRAKAGADNAYKDFKVGYLYDDSKRRRLVGVTAGNHEAAGRMLRRLSDQIGLRRANERVALVDGAPWIRNQFEFHGLVDAIGLDFYHLQENAQKARRIVFGEESPEGRAWLGQLMHTFKHEGYDAGWDRVEVLRRQASEPQQTGGHRPSAVICRGTPRNDPLSGVPVQRLANRLGPDGGRMQDNDAPS